MKLYQSALVVSLAAATAVMPSAAQQVPPTPQALPIETCAGCFAYLEFSPALEPESYAKHGLATVTSASSPAAGEASSRVREQTAGLLAPSKQ